MPLKRKGERGGNPGTRRPNSISGKHGWTLADNALDTKRAHKEPKEKRRLGRNGSKGKTGEGRLGGKNGLHSTETPGRTVPIETASPKGEFVRNIGTTKAGRPWKTMVD